MTARPQDGAAGYRFYLQHDGAVELEEINEHLRGIDLREVKPRMLKHYQKLRKHGYQSYITQNRLDLAVAGEPGWLEELQARYAEISQSVPVEVEWLPAGFATGKADAIGLASATAFVNEVPTAGTAVIFRLSKSGIEKVATVVRSDKASGRVHLRFDLYGSLPIAPKSAKHQLRLTTTVPPEAESFPSIADLLLRIERAVSMAAPRSEQLPRISSLSMTSPFDVTLLSSNPWHAAVALLLAVPVLRRQWHEGTLKKYEAVKAKNELENVSAPTELTIIESDERLIREIDKALDDLDGDVADGLAESLTANGADPDNLKLTRRELFSAVRAFVFLPIELTEPGVVDDEAP